MNLKQLCEYLRIHLGTFRRNLYNGEYSDMPRETVRVKYKDKAGRNRSRLEYKFNLQVVLDYLKKKFNDDRN